MLEDVREFALAKSDCPVFHGMYTLAQVCRTMMMSCVLCVYCVSFVLCVCAYVCCRIYADLHVVLSYNGLLSFANT